MGGDAGGFLASSFDRLAKRKDLAAPPGNAHVGVACFEFFKQIKCHFLQKQRFFQLETAA
ncbi:hypothetical protein ACFQO0_04910 [Herminiimonas aquatilis]|uniref:Uncharacterized protein n=1 Tax=Herminiimonas aquatilis TaxID=345342 RepID=A0ABW2J310_9BURK